MEFSTTANDIVASPYFVVLMVVGLVAIGVVLRMTFRSTIPEYKYNPDTE